MWPLIFMFLFPLFTPGLKPEEKIKHAIKTELDYFPEARLRDIYKNFFQDAYGPGHLIPDTTHAGKYLDHELQQYIGDTLLWQPVGMHGDYYRVNLTLVKNGVIPRGVLLEAMVESAPLARNPDIETWKKQWHEIMKVIEQMNLHIDDFEQDKQAIETLFSDNEYVMHHSDHYNNTYNRHYRIIHRSVFDRWRNSYLKDFKE